MSITIRIVGSSVMLKMARCRLRLPQLKTPRGYVQGYDVQAVSEQQIVIAADAWQLTDQEGARRCPRRARVAFATRTVDRLPRLDGLVIEPTGEAIGAAPVFSPSGKPIPRGWIGKRCSASA